MDLAEMLLRNWEYDEESLELFKYYRISSNAIYPFQLNGKTQFLRFSPKGEKDKGNILAELDFISYLASNQYGVLKTAAAKNGKKIVEMQTPWGDYYASVFKRVAGVQLNKTDLSDQVIISYGKSLGKLQKLSSEYKPLNNKRWSYKDVLNWILTILDEFPNEKLASKETELLQKYFDSIPMTKDNFGLIHYDFEYDNVFYDEKTKLCYVIDFDDSMYHWYVMDIERSVSSLQDCIQPEVLQQKKQMFMDGYRTEFEIPDKMLSLLPACRRFAHLYGYVRVLRSLKDKWGHEPEWLIHLRASLTEAMKEDSLYFGKEI